MITIYICALLGAILLTYLNFKVLKEFSKEFIPEYAMSIILGLIAGAGIGVFVSLFLPKNTTKEYTYYKLENLQDKNSINGSLFLGIGGIDEEMKYTFYYEDNGFYKMNQLPYNLVKIKYSNNTPRVITIKNILDDSFINYFSIGFYEHEEYIVEIPYGSIKNGYNLDSK